MHVQCLIMAPYVATSGSVKRVKSTASKTRLFIGQYGNFPYLKLHIILNVIACNYNALTKYYWGCGYETKCSLKPWLHMLDKTQCTVSREVSKVGVSPCIRQRSAVLPETPVQLLPITAGMYPWVGCQECGSILLIWWPPAWATCEILTFHTLIFPMNPQSPLTNIRTARSNCWTHLKLHWGI